MANKTSKYLPAAAVALVIIVLAGIQYFRKQKPADKGQGQEAGREQSQQGSPKPTPQTPGMLEGTLKISDNLKRGNLMVAMPERTVYLFTSRDYSSLLDKTVKVEIEGTLENFRLVDIKAK